MKTLSRLLKHLFTWTVHARRCFPEPTLKAVENLITEGERRHRAEVHLVIEPSLSPFSVLDGMSSRERAAHLFSEYRIWDTEENCGVLVYVNLADHQVEIVADRGVSRIIPSEQWARVCRTMTDAFRRGEYHRGATSALLQLNDLLEQHYPDNGLLNNEIPNRPVVI